MSVMNSLKQDGTVSTEASFYAPGLNNDYLIQLISWAQYCKTLKSSHDMVDHGLFSRPFVLHKWPMYHVIEALPWRVYAVSMNSKECASPSYGFTILFALLVAFKVPIVLPLCIQSCFKVLHYLQGCLPQMSS